MANDSREVLAKGLSDLPTGWKWRWQDEVFAFQGGSQPPAATFVDSPGPGYVRLIQIRDYYTDSHKTYIPDSAKLRKCDASDVMIARYGSSDDARSDNSLGRICRGLNGAYNVALAKTIPAPDIERSFLYYLLKSDYFQAPLRAQGTRSVQAGFNRDSLRVILLPVPPPSEQRAIAHILGTLDDKIELNRRVSETLDAMVRALFKSWFVDFDPVRAKQEGRDPRLPKTLADLFPARFVDSGLGEIPEGWPIDTLADHCEAVKGVSYKGSGLGDDGMPLHNLNSIYEGGGYKYEGIKYYSEEYSERHTVLPGDVIVANTEQGHDRLLIGYAAIVPSFFGQRGIASHHIYRLRAIAGSPLTPTFLCWLLNSPRMHDAVSGYANGTTVNMLPFDGVQKPLFPCPQRDLVAVFDSIAVKAERRRQGLVAESSALEALRDTLLPKLISGEMRVKDAENFVEKAT
jgi:type I restriction enzyme, S subunit